MEIKIYCSLKAFSERKPNFVKRVEVDSSVYFDFSATIKVFKSLFGEKSIIEFVVL